VILEALHNKSSGVETTLDSLDVAVSFFRFKYNLSATAGARLVPTQLMATDGAGTMKSMKVCGSSCHWLHSNLWGDHNTYRRRTMPGQAGYIPSEALEPFGICGKVVGHLKEAANFGPVFFCVWTS